MPSIKRLLLFPVVLFVSVVLISCDGDNPTEPPPPQVGDYWTLRPTGTSNYLFDAAWSEQQQRYVSVGEEGVILTSPDGIIWTTQPSPTSRDLYGVTWSGKQFVAVGDAGTIIASPNGITWTVDSSATSNWLYGIASSGDRFVAVGQNGTIVTSGNGETWDAVTVMDTVIAGDLILVTAITVHLYGVTWADGEFIVVGGGVVLKSLDGTSWTVVNSNLGLYLYDIIWSGTQYVAVG